MHLFPTKTLFYQYLNMYIDITMTSQAKWEEENNYFHTYIEHNENFIVTWNENLEVTKFAWYIIKILRIEF